MNLQVFKNIKCSAVMLMSYAIFQISSVKLFPETAIFLCIFILEYEVPMSTSSLSLIYETRDQLAAACLQKFQETSDANYDRFKRSIVDTCGQLGVTANNLKIENITSISLAFQVNSLLGISSR